MATESIVFRDASGSDLVSPIVQEAVLRGTSDIHIEAMPDEVLVRFRIDGVLQTHAHVAKGDHEHVINHLKVLCNMEVVS